MPAAKKAGLVQPDAGTGRIYSYAERDLYNLVDLVAH